MSDKPSFTVVYECQDESEQPDIAVGYSGNDFSAFRLIVIGDGDFVQRYNYERELAERLQQQLTAANARVEELEEGVKNALRPHLGGNPYCISSADLDALVALLEKEKSE